MILTRKLFRTGLECRRKLVYRRDGFPAEKRIPHEGFFALVPWARTLFPGGYQPEQEPDTCRELIDRALKENRTQTFFAPVLIHKGSLAHPEILQVGSDRLVLYHLTEKTINTEEEADPVLAASRYLKAEWKDILRDAAYDASVIALLFPEISLSVRFVMPDRSVATGNDPGSADPHEPGDGTADFLVIRNLDDTVLPLMEETTASLLRMVAVLAGGDTPPRKGLHCRHCEYRPTDELHPRSGFDICWDLPEQKDPEILWLSHVAQVDETSGGLISRMIRENRRHFGELPREELSGSLDAKQDLQISGESERLSPAWQKVRNQLEYPLYFLDFEIARTAVPLHRGMKPFDRLLFEWSCHRIDEPGLKPVHAVWLNTKPSIPNLDFARSLKTFLGDRGSILTWSRFENSQIRYLSDTLSDETGLADWLESYHKRSFDMEEWTRRFYHHPEARGRTSLKSILAAALSRGFTEEARLLLADENLLKDNASGGLVNPYDLLEGHEAVRGGTGAVSAYLAMVYGAGHEDGALRQRLDIALRNYCRLDTLAMVILWLHWNERIKNPQII